MTSSIGLTPQLVNSGYAAGDKNHADLTGKKSVESRHVSMRRRLAE